MALRWVRDGLFLELQDADARPLGTVVRSYLNRKTWLGWEGPRGQVDAFPTRDAAMRAVASRCDQKKGHGLG